MSGHGRCWLERGSRSVRSAYAVALLTLSAAAGRSSNPITLLGFGQHAYENMEVVPRADHRQKTHNASRKNWRVRDRTVPEPLQCRDTLVSAADQLAALMHMQLLARIPRIRLLSHQSSAPGRRRRFRRCVGITIIL